MFKRVNHKLESVRSLLDRSPSEDLLFLHETYLRKWKLLRRMGDTRAAIQCEDIIKYIKRKLEVTDDDDKVDD